MVGNGGNSKGFQAQINTNRSFVLGKVCAAAQGRDLLAQLNPVCYEGAVAGQATAPLA